MRTLPILLATACTTSQVTAPDPGPAAPPVPIVVSASDVVWEQLNPARGDESPKAATLWGDRDGSGPTGFLVEFADGFSSPPHIHNVSYRGVVVTGLVHNDVPDAKEMWMPSGSYWTQPKGGVHITAAKGEKTVAYIEIEQGPYLVLPVEEAFQSDEKPRNVDAASIGWINSATNAASGSRAAQLWGHPQDGQLNGRLIELPAGSRGQINHGSTVRGVVIQGRVEHRAPGGADAKILEPGSYVSSSELRVSCAATETCILYVRSTGELNLRTELRDAE